MVEYAGKKVIGSGGGVNGWLGSYNGSEDTAAAQIVATTMHPVDTGVDDAHQRIKMACLPSGQTIVVYKTSATLLKGLSFVPGVSVGTEFSIGSGTVYDFDVCAVDDDKFAVAYCGGGFGAGVKTYTMASNVATLDASYEPSGGGTNRYIAMRFRSPTLGCVAYTTNSGSVSAVGMTAGDGTLVARGSIDTETLDDVAGPFSMQETTGGDFILRMKSYNSATYVVALQLVQLSDDDSDVLFGTVSSIAVMDGPSDIYGGETDGKFDLVSYLVTNADGSCGLAGDSSLQQGNADHESLCIPAAVPFYNGSGTITPNDSVTYRPYRYGRGESCLMGLLDATRMETSVDIDGVEYDIFLGVFYGQRSTNAPGIDCGYYVRGFALPSAPTELADVAETGILLGVHRSEFILSGADYFSATSPNAGNYGDFISGVCIRRVSDDQAVVAYEDLASNDPYFVLINKE